MQTITIEALMAHHQKLSTLPMYQIWAEAVFHGKDIENRDRPIRKRGTILVYATAARKGQRQSLVTLHEREQLLGRSLFSEGTPIYYGALLGAIDLVNCTDNTHPQEWVGVWGMPRSFHWHLANPRRFDEPIPYRPNSQGWFFVTAQSLAEQQQREVEFA